MSVFDSPAYANLSTRYLNEVFNPTTPDNPHVRYYSVAARTDVISILHPLWLPKTVLDASEKEAQERHPNPDNEEWGNDGLVSVRSARWGEFLGILEGCDHWDVRGTRSIRTRSNNDIGGSGSGSDWHVNIPLFADLLSSLSDPLKKAEWIQILGERRNEERKRREGKSKRTGNIDAQGSQNGAKDEIEDEIIRSSTEKVSAMIDWATEQVTTSLHLSGLTPTSLVTSSSSSSLASVQKKDRECIDVMKGKEAEDLRPKFDVERFYVSLCRKLYNDGL